jgi:hypothetical protein
MRRTSEDAPRNSVPMIPKKETVSRSPEAAARWNAMRKLVWTPHANISTRKV